MHGVKQVLTLANSNNQLVQMFQNFLISSIISYKLEITANKSNYKRAINEQNLLSWKARDRGENHKRDCARDYFEQVYKSVTVRFTLLPIVQVYY